MGKTTNNISEQIQKEIREYLTEENCNKQYKNYNNLIIDYPYIDVIVKDTIEEELGIDNYNDKFENIYKEIIEKIDAKIPAITKIKREVDDEFDEYQYRAINYYNYGKCNYAEFDNINDFILRLIELNKKIYANNASVEEIKERDKLIVTILYHKTFAVALHKLSIETTKFYKSTNIYSSYDVESFEIIYQELAINILRKMKPKFKLDNPEAYTYSFLFGKNKYKNNLSPIENAYNDWKETEKTKKDILIKNAYVLKENLPSEVIGWDGESHNDYQEALDKLSVEKDEIEEIDKLIDLEDELEEVKRKSNVTYYYKKYNIKYNAFLFSHVERWVEFLRELVFDCKNYIQKDIIKYYYYGNYSFYKISKIVGLDITNVRRNHTRVIQSARNKILNSCFYKVYPDLKLISKYVNDYWGIYLYQIYNLEPYSPLIIAIEKEKIKELKQAN